MSKLVLLRHLQSEWNKDNRFSGWTDVVLSKEGRESAKNIAEKVAGEKFDAAYTSPLIRNKETAFLILENLGKKAVFMDPGQKEDLAENSLPVFVSAALDEKHYGDLQGANRDESAKNYGKEQVRLWRRSWNQAPPGGESLKDVYNRVVPFYQNYIEKDLEQGKNVLVVASHNSLRALAKYIENISDEDVINLEIANGEAKIYEMETDKRG